MPRSRHAYTWNHSRPSLTARTSSIERVLSVDSVYGSPARAAARATASSPCGIGDARETRRREHERVRERLSEERRRRPRPRRCRAARAAGTSPRRTRARSRRAFARPPRRRRCSRTPRPAAAAWRCAAGRPPTPARFSRRSTGSVSIRSNRMTDRSVVNGFTAQFSLARRAPHRTDVRSGRRRPSATSRGGAFPRRRSSARGHARGAVRAWRS